VLTSRRLGAHRRLENTRLKRLGAHRRLTQLGGHKRHNRHRQLGAHKRIGVF
jgi:hypothetical protein